MESEMKYIYTVYQKGSFAKAAQSLYLTQPALSIAVQKVEARIGMPLFDRGQKPLKLTSAGEIYIEKIEEILHIEKELQEKIQDLSDLNTGNIKIGATSYFFSCILPPVLLEYQKQYPNVQLDIVENGAYELKKMLLDKKIDLTFVSRPAKEPNFKNKFVFQDELVLAVPASFPVNEALSSFAMTSEEVLRSSPASHPPVDLKAFSDTPFVLLKSTYDLRHRARLFFETAGISPAVRMEASQMATLYALTEAGIGASFISNRIINKPSPQCLFYRIEHPEAIREMNIVTNRHCYLSHPVEKFIKLFVDYYQKK